MWSPTTTDYQTTDVIVPLPDADQTALMDTVYTAADVIDDSFPATVGMFGMQYDTDR